MFFFFFDVQQLWVNLLPAPEACRYHSFSFHPFLSVSPLHFSSSALAGFDVQQLWVNLLPGSTLAKLPSCKLFRAKKLKKRVCPADILSTDKMLEPVGRGIIQSKQLRTSRPLTGLEHWGLNAAYGLEL
jgi:hypothetical protein